MQLTESDRDYNHGVLDWRTMRAAFIRARGRTPQHAIAAKGGLRQNAISKMEANDNLGPAVETFVRAIYGLGMQPSEFFKQLEQSRASDRKGHSELESKSLPNRQVSDTTTLLTQRGATTDGGSIPHADAATLKSEIINTIVLALINADKHSADAHTARDREERSRLRKKVR